MDNLHYITICGVICGCGLAQMYGILYYIRDGNPNRENFERELDNLDLKEHGIGAIIATLGDDFVEVYDKMSELGFEEVKEYSNYRHSQEGHYKQKLYIKVL